MNMASRKRRAPYDPSRPVHDRRTVDLLKDAQLAPMEVDDPYERGEKILVMRSVRNDPLARFHDRGFIDEAQYQGGRAFQKDFETVERGPRAIDYGKECVDGGLTPEPITEAQRKAALSLKRAYKKLEADGSAIIHDFLISGLTMAEIAQKRGLLGRKWEEYFGQHVRRLLHKLAYVYGFAREPDGERRIHSQPAS